MYVAPESKLLVAMANVVSTSPEEDNNDTPTVEW